MSLYDLQQAGPQPRTTDPNHAAALAINEAAAKAYEQIRSDRTLSDDGKRARMAPVYLKSQQDMAALQQRAAEATAKQKTQLSRAAFGVPSDPIAAMSYRDAIGRAEQITDPRIAAAHLERSLNTGDDLMAQAVAQHAAESGWRDVLDTYTAARPAVGEALTQLNDLNARQASFQNKLVDAGYYRTAKPDEFGRLDDWQIESFAAQQAGQG